MVAIVHQSSSIRNALHYNENKLKAKVAQLIHSGNYPKDTELLGFSDKINRLERQAALNQRTKVNSVHISINFPVNENLNTEKLKQIVDVYMRKIGFGEQPYLVYQHHDSGHPHIHIVTTNIKKDGKRIELHNLARNQSFAAAQEIEKEFKLIPALQKERLSNELKPVNFQRVQYGKSETKRAITNVLDHVLPTYKYTSLPELNAVLRQYNVVADRGTEDSRTYKNRGLVFRVMNEKGVKQGVPIKASNIYNKPTLDKIERRFSENENARQVDKQRLRNAIDFSLAKHPGQTIQELVKDLQKDQISVLLRQNDKGLIYGITYIDHKTKSVFNGSDLGRSYSSNAMQQRCRPEYLPDKISESSLKQVPMLPQSIQDSKINIEVGQNTIPDLLLAQQGEVSVPFELKQFKKRKRKQKLSQP